MKKLLTFIKKYRNENDIFYDISYVISILLVCALPLWMELANVLIALLLMSSIVQAISLKLKPTFNVQLLGLSCFFLLNFLTLLYSNGQGGIEKIETKLSLIVLPFIFTIFQLRTRTDLRKILLFFIGAITFFSFICYLNAYIKCHCFYDDRDSWLSSFHRENYTNIIGGIHVSYFSTYILFAIGLILFHVNLIKKVYLKLLLLIILSSSILIMAGKNAVFVMMILVCFFILKSGTKTIRYVYILLICVSLGLTIYNSDILQKRFSNPESVRMKIGQWKAALQVFGQSPLLGVGVGNSDKLISKRYLINNDQVNYKHNYGTHNQYLNILVTTGILGFGIWTYCIIASFRFSLNSNLVPLSIFIFIFSASILTENMLNLQKGVVFFSFFYSLLNSLNRERFPG